jgi:hypothetical protein
VNLKSISGFFLLTVISTGCSVVKTVDVIGTDNSKGVVQLGYTYGLLEVPKAEWDQALVKASAKCKSMGYLSAKSPATEPLKECIQNDQSGNCTKFAVTLNYDCNLSQEAAQQRQLKKEKQIADYAKEYPYVATFTCSVGNSNIMFAACLKSHSGYKTELELTNGNEYGLYNILDYRKIGNDTNEGLSVPLRERFKIKIQNAGDSAKLTLTIKNTATGEQTFIKSAAKWDYIYIAN